jgi:hypothetical protein
MITFATVTDVPIQVPVQGQNQVANITIRNVIQEELAIALPWPVLKTFVMQLNDVMRAIENQVGPIKATRSGATSDQLVKAYEQVLQRVEKISTKRLPKFCCFAWNKKIMSISIREWAHRS